MTTWADPERRELLKTLLAEGKSASQIATIIGGGISRNAVISAAHRYGFYVRENPTMRKFGKHIPKNPPPPSGPRPTGLATWVPPLDRPIPCDDAIPARRKTLVDLEPDDCRWPIGDPQHPDFTFCDSKKIIGKPYCEHHCRMAYEPPVPATRLRHAPRVVNPVKETEDA